MKSLKKLILKDNDLKTFNADVLLQPVIKSIKAITLNENGLEDIKRENWKNTMISTFELAQINIRDNPIKCHCDLKFIDEFDRKSVDFNIGCDDETKEIKVQEFTQRPECNSGIKMISIKYISPTNQEISCEPDKVVDSSGKSMFSTVWQTLSSKFNVVKNLISDTIKVSSKNSKSVQRCNMKSASKIVDSIVVEVLPYENVHPVPIKSMNFDRSILLPIGCFLFAVLTILTHQAYIRGFFSRLFANKDTVEKSKAVTSTSERLRTAASINVCT